MALIGIWSVSSLKLGDDCLEHNSNNVNDGKNLVVLYQPQKWWIDIPWLFEVIEGIS